MSGRQAARALALCAAVALIASERVATQGARLPIRGIETVAGHRAAAGEVLVRFRRAVPAAALAALGVDASEPLAGGVQRLRSRRSTAAALVAALSARPDVVFAEPNFIAEVSAVPSDPYFSAQAALLNAQRPGADIHATGAWDLATGTRASVVALLDSGVDATHPDLVENLWSSPAPFTVNVAGRSISCPAGAIGFDAVLLTCEPHDDHGHGTAMAGIIGAAADNGIGVAGINWTTSILVLKFIGPDGLGSYADAINAIDFAVQVRDIFGSGAAPIRVLSNSWGGTEYSQALLEAFQRAASRDILSVAAAGNDGHDNDAQPAYPASFDDPSLMSVLATGVDDSREPYSNFGASSVDLGAPGLTYSTARGGTYAATSGTSAAAAVASGAAALVRSRCGLSARDLKSLLLATVDPVEDLRFVSVTGGRLNVERALAACRGANDAPLVSIVSPGAGPLPVAEPVVVRADAFDGDGSVVAVDFYAGARWIGRDAAAPYEASFTPQSAGTYVLTAVATDNLGATATASRVAIQAGTLAVAVPAPWALADIGLVATPGAAAFDGAAVSVRGGGADVWGTSDAFTYVYQRLDGDGEILARVASVEAVSAWTKAGVMMRATLAPSSPHAFMLVSAAKGAAFQRRLSEGTVTTHTDGGAMAAPAWVRLARSGQVVTASMSSDGAHWAVVGTDTIAWGASIYAGLAVSSHATEGSATAVFDGLAVSSTPPPAPPPTLPEGWSSADVGSVGVAGASSGAGQQFTIAGAGADIWGTSDAFHFAYRPLDGDGAIVARVTSLDAAASWTKAGVMIRDSLDVGSAHAFMLVSAAKGAAFQRRLRGGELTLHTGTPGAVPLWIKLSRAGPRITAEVSADGSSWTTVGEDVFEMGSTVLAGLAVSSHDASRTASAIFSEVSVTSGSAPRLPAGWASADVGVTGPPGSSTAIDGTFTVAGAGADIWGTADAFQFAHTTLAGDGSITARLSSLQAVHAWTKAGVMIRQSLDPASSHAFMLVSAGKGVAFQRRLAPGGETLHTSGGAGAAPAWVRITRTGSTLVAYTSSDGIAWTVVATESLPLPPVVYVGLAVCSHDSGQAATAVFSDVAVGS